MTSWLDVTHGPRRMDTTENAKALYRKRKQTVEPVFGIIKSAMGFVRFSLRGIKNVATDWVLAALAYNCRRVSRLKAA